MNTSMTFLIKSENIIIITFEMMLQHYYWHFLTVE
jgi:hypothetical protein